MSVFARIFERREPPHLEALDRALGAREASYRQMLALAGQALFARTQREGELGERRAAIARLHDRAREAARAGREDEARVYLAQKRHLLDAVAQDETDLVAARADAYEAERRLVELGAAIEALRRGRQRALASERARAVHTTAVRPLGPRTAAAVAAAEEHARELRARIDGHRSLDSEDDPGVVLELRALTGGRDTP